MDSRLILRTEESVRRKCKSVKDSKMYAQCAGSAGTVPCLSVGNYASSDVGNVLLGAKKQEEKELETEKTNYESLRRESD